MKTKPDLDSISRTDGPLAQLARTCDAARAELEEAHDAVMRLPDGASDVRVRQAEARFGPMKTPDSTCGQAAAARTGADADVGVTTKRRGLSDVEKLDRRDRVVLRLIGRTPEQLAATEETPFEALRRARARLMGTPSERPELTLIRGGRDAE